MLKKIPSWLQVVLKVLVTVVCLWYVGRKIDWLQTWELLKQSHKLWLLLATAFFMASKWISSIRLNIYFKNISIHLPESTNLRLYWLGMFYNLFLPGGIGGDAYKVILLQRRGIASSYKLTSAAVLLDRISGVAGLGILAAIGYFLLFKPGLDAWLVVAAILPGLALYYFLVKRFFPSFITSYYSTLLMGIAVQLLQVACTWCLMMSIEVTHHFLPFQFIFLLSSMVAILPFTIGGLGAREIVFLWGASQFGLDQHEAVYVSLLFYLVTVVVSSVGAVWVYRDPLQSVVTPK